MLGLFFNSDQQRFKEELNYLISEVPTNTENFWIYLLLGGVLTLPYVAGKKIRLKLDDNQNTIKLLYPGEEKPIIRVVTTENNIGFSIQEVNNLKKIKKCYNISDQEWKELFINDTVYKIDKDGRKYKIKIKNAKRLSGPSGSFIEIGRIPGLKPKKELCDIFAELNDSSLDTEDKQKATEILFNQLRDIYNYYAENLNLKKNVEALHQAFIYGFFKMHFGNQVKCLLEVSAGSGYADLVLMIGNTSIIVELKVGNTSAKEAIEQIENRGYAHSSFVNEYENIILVGMNLNTGEVSVESHKKFTSKGLINKLVSLQRNINNESSFSDDYSSNEQSEDEDLEVSSSDESSREMDEEVNSSSELDKEPDELSENDNNSEEDNITKELAFLCHSKNIGICDPNDSLTYNKSIGSFAAFLYGQVLQYCSYNENYTSEFQSINREGSSSITLTYEGNDVLFIQVIESYDKAGFQSPDCNEAGHYSTKIKITKGSESFIYKINKSNEGVEVKFDEQNEHNDSLPRKSPRKAKKTQMCAQEECVSSQESKRTASPFRPEHYDLKSLCEEIKNGQFESLKEILEDNYKVFNSEGNLQLFLKGLLMNIPGLIVEAEVGNTDKRADLVIKFSNGTAVIFELKFYENEGEQCRKLKEAKEQLEGYVSGGILQEIIDCKKLNLVVVLFCKQNNKCIISGKTTPSSSRSSSRSRNDSGLGSSHTISIFLSTRIFT